MPDTRFIPLVIYHKRFLIWWGISLYLFQLGSRRQLDFDLDDRGTQVLNNLNRFAQTEQETRPVHDTLDHFLEHTGAAPFAALRSRMLHRLIRMKSLDAACLQGRFVVALDATGHLAFRQPHCPKCLVYRHATHTAYLHQVLEAKLLGPAGLGLVWRASHVREAAQPARTGSLPAWNGTWPWRGESWHAIKRWRVRPSERGGCRRLRRRIHPRRQAARGRGRVGTPLMERGRGAAGPRCEPCGRHGCCAPRIPLESIRQSRYKAVRPHPAPTRKPRPKHRGPLPSLRGKHLRTRESK